MLARRGSNTMLSVGFGLALLCGPFCTRADKVTLKGGESIDGTFEEFKSDKFVFKLKDEKVRAEPRINLESVLLEPPANVVVKPRSQKKREDLRLKAYEKPNFVFLQGGKELRMPASEVSFIEMGLDFGRMIPTEVEGGPAPKPAENAETKQAEAKQDEVKGGDADHEEAAAPNGEKPNGEKDEIAKLVKRGTVTVIHFRPVASDFDPVAKMASTRMASYLAATAKKNKGKITVASVDIKSWDDPVATKHNITALPQFWFYDRAGKLSTKLVDRFTEADVENAIKAARH